MLNMNLTEEEKEEYLSRQREERDRCSQHGEPENKTESNNTTTATETSDDEEFVSRSISSPVGKSSSRSKLLEAGLRTSGSKTIVSRSPSQNRLVKKRKQR